MKLIVWIVRIVVFIALFGLAVKNSSTVSLRFFFEQSWQVPLSLVVLLTFVAGVGVGLTAVVATLVSQRRELGKLRRAQDADQPITK